MTTYLMPAYYRLLEGIRMGIVEAMNEEITALRHRVAQLDDTSRLHEQRLDGFGERLSELASHATPAMELKSQQIPFVNHPVPGEKGWVTSQGKKIEILGFDEVSGDVWCRFPTSDTNRDTYRTYRYPPKHWERYWTKYWVDYEVAEETTTQIDVELDIDMIAERLRKEFKIIRETSESLTGEPLSPRLEVFMRQTLTALSTLMQHNTGMTSIKMTAFDPPLAPVPGGPRHIPPGESPEDDSCPSCGAEASWIGPPDSDHCLDSWHGGV